MAPTNSGSNPIHRRIFKRWCVERASDGRLNSAKFMILKIQTMAGMHTLRQMNGRNGMPTTPRGRPGAAIDFEDRRPMEL